MHLLGTGQANRCYMHVMRVETLCSTRAWRNSHLGPTTSFHILSALLPLRDLQVGKLSGALLLDALFAARLRFPSTRQGQRQLELVRVDPCMRSDLMCCRMREQSARRPSQWLTLVRVQTDRACWKYGGQ